jgi:small subunit ribosomal protein S4
MGDPKKQRKRYETPRHPWSKEQLDVELGLMGEYGLRNKRELWRYRTILSRTRGIARSLLGKSVEERAAAEKQFLARLVKEGLVSEGASIDEVLDLDIRDLLERRLQTMVFRSGLANSPYQARQLISHGHISVGTRTVRIPGYLVTRAEETRIRYSPVSPLARHEHRTRKAMVADTSGSKATLGASEELGP